jgi:GNAT superfamily N-acetyltransferase
VYDYATLTHELPLSSPRLLSRSREHGLALIIRSARVDELPGLSDLCFRSKAVWGYDKEFMEACRGELSFSPRGLETTHVAVAEEDCKILGVVQVRINAGNADLLKLFVEPELLRKGTGKALFAWATDISRRTGAHHVIIEADPDAVPFYRRMGARDAGTAPSTSIPGRTLPRLTFDVMQNTLG